MSHASRVLAWYDRHRRTLPWRAPAGERAEPYIVWLSEIMLQQTTVATVGDYFRRFVARWPTVETLAAAPIDDVLSAWAGLGYYARARNLHACARVVTEQLGGRFPEDEEGLRALPGIGSYTAAAIAAIAFDRPASAVDGNVERVIARLFSIETPLPDAKPEIAGRAARLVPRKRAGDYAQALMDLGATVCTPRAPRCMLCPIADDCRARSRGIAEQLPARLTKRQKPTRRGLAFVLARRDGAILLRKRPAKGLLGGMDEVPSSAWREGMLAAESALACGARARRLRGAAVLTLGLPARELPKERAGIGGVHLGERFAQSLARGRVEPAQLPFDMGNDPGPHRLESKRRARPPFRVEQLVQEPSNLI